MRDIVTALLSRAPGAEDHCLASSGWLQSQSSAQLRAFYEEYEQRHAVALGELVASLGQPECTLEDTPDWFEAWYPEAFAAAVWTLQGKYICLAAAHDDRETPVMLLLRCLTPGELAALLAQE